MCVFLPSSFPPLARYLTSNVGKNTAQSKGHDITCVYCRTKWVFPAAAASTSAAGNAAGNARARVSEGYLNLSGVAGLSPVRDTSSCESSSCTPSHGWNLRRVSVRHRIRHHRSLFSLKLRSDDANHILACRLQWPAPRTAILRVSRLRRLLLMLAPLMRDLGLSCSSLHWQPLDSSSPHAPLFCVYLATNCNV